MLNKMSTFQVIFKKSSVSNFLIIFLFIILLIDIGNGLINIRFLNKNLKDNSQIINTLGILKGDMQRYTKLKIANKNYQTMEDFINKTFPYTYKLINKKGILKPHDKFCFSYLKARKLWSQLKKEHSANRLIFLSEEAWEITNNMTFAIQRLFNQKFIELKDVIIIITLSSSFIILLLILIIYYVIKKGLEIDNVTDGLTQLYNRIFFNEQLVFFIDKYEQNKSPFVLLFFDIDDFKKINDTYGHDVGDEVLKKISLIMKKSIRKTDLACRYGGEEFAIIFPNTTLEQAKTSLDRFEKNLKELKIDDKNITVSGAIVEYKDEGLMDFIKQVDNALYEVKENGKNNIKILN